MKDGHSHNHAFESFNALSPEGLSIRTRRNLLKASVAGIAGLTAPDLLRLRAEAAQAGRSIGKNKSVILLWMTGGPSHIDTFDPKPDRPLNNRGPFGVSNTKIPGVIICEHLPKLAAMLDRFTVIRSVDCRKSNHEPNMVMQTGNRDAEPRLNPNARMYPGIGCVIAKHRAGQSTGIPPYIAFHRSETHIPAAGYLGKQYDPFQGNSIARLPIYDDIGRDTGQLGGQNLFQLAGGLTDAQVYDRRRLRQRIDRLRAGIDASGMMDAMDAYNQQAVEMVVGKKARDAFDMFKEAPKIRERYGKHLWCQQALLARRLVEAGVAFVSLDLSYHPASGTWDTHGDNVPPYGGIKKGLGPLLPLFDHLVTTLVGDLGERGLLDDVLVLAMGEFGRTPNMGTQDSTDGRNHWPVVMSMLLAGGGMRHGQVIGATDRDGGAIKFRPVTPGDLAATIYRHMGVPLDTTYLDFTGRPNYLVEDGKPIEELL